MRKLLLSVFAMGFAFSGFSQQNELVLSGREAHEKVPGAEVVRYRYSPVPDYVRFRPGAGLSPDKSQAWLEKFLQLGEEDSWQVLREEQDELGFTHKVLGQLHNGQPVMGNEYHLHQRGGEILSLNGKFWPGLRTAAAPLITEEAALATALKHMPAESYRWEIPAEEQLLRAKTGDLSATWLPKGQPWIVPVGGDFKNPEFRLTWRFDVYSIKPLGRKYIYVDALDGTVIWEQERIHHVDAPGVAFTKYSGTQNFTTDDTGTNFRLRETGRGNGIETYDMNTGTSYGAAVDFIDADNSWNNINAQQDEVATDAHWGAEKTYDYYWLNYGRNSIDGAGFKLESYVHYDVDYDNAFWDGSVMTYGDGSGSFFTPLTALDVCGHEITHGLTTFTSNLIYSGESGALNESFSDIFGNVIEWYGRPSDHSWLIGEDCTTPGAGGAIRDMQNPNAFNCPDTYLGTDWDPFEEVHTNSGVQNKWFYILTDGETGTNDNGDAYSVTGQGFTKAGAIAFRNNTVYLTPSSDYADARFYSIQSAVDLYGGCTAEVQATTDAWYAVGVGPAYVPYALADFAGSPISYCDVPANVTFTNLSVNGITYQWNFGDGGTSTATSPTHTYTSFGTYTVTLIVDGGACGRDTLVMTDYIFIDTSAVCAISMTPGTNTTQTSCNGTLYDTGGPSGDYGTDEDNTITIAPPGASSVTLDFTSFATEAGYDYLYIYDGPTTSSPLIGSYDGSALPGGGTIVSTTGAITLKFTSDGFVEDAGFAVNWMCMLPTAVPSVDFTSDVTETCLGTVHFTDLTTGGASSWAWTFGDGGTSTLQNPTHTYAAPGTYTVRLTATNIVGSAFEEKTSYITVTDVTSPVAPGTSLCTPGSVTLTATGGAGATFYWYTVPTGGSPVSTSSSYTTPVLSSATTYYVAQEIPAPSGFVGEDDPIGLGGSYHNNTSTQYLEFTVTSNITLKSVYVDPGAAGPRTIQVWNSAGTLLWDTTMTIGAAPGRITLNKKFTPGDYRIGGTEMDLWRNNAGGLAYPYVLPGQVEITGSSAGADRYYYFYDWEVVGPGCLSDRTPVPVTFTAGVTADFNATATSLVVDFSNLSVGGSVYEWNFGDGGTSTLANPSHTYAASGTYSVRLITSDGSGSCRDTIIKTVSVTFIGVDPSQGAVSSANFWPNPFSSELQLSLSLTSTEVVEVTAMDATGRMVSTIFSGKLPAGTHGMVWNPDAHLAEGIYLIRLQAGDQVIHRKLVHIK
jgi:Zn-dependent metalloprotease